MRPLGAWLRGPPPNLGGAPPALGEGDPALQPSKPSKSPAGGEPLPQGARWKANPAVPVLPPRAQDPAQAPFEHEEDDGQDTNAGHSMQISQAKDADALSDSPADDDEETQSNSAVANDRDSAADMVLVGLEPEQASAASTHPEDEIGEDSADGDAPPASQIAPPHVPTALGEDLDAWLRELRLELLRSAVWKWCEDQGAATLEEVVEYAKDLASDLNLPLAQKNVLLRQGQAALTRVCASGRKRRGSRPAPPSCVSLAQQGSLGLQQHQLLQNGCQRSPRSGQSSSSAWSAPSSREGTAQRPRGTSSASGASPGGEMSTRSGGSTQRMSLENWDWPNVWLSTKERQGKKKKQDRLQRGRMGGSGGLPSTDEVKDRQEAAQAKLARQLEEEQIRQRDSALGRLEKSLTSDQVDDLRNAIDDMGKAGLASHDLVQKAQQKLEQLVRNTKQRCADAVLRLQAGLEAARDDRFGSDMRDALASAPDALQAQGGQKAVEEAQAALREWEEVCISLHMAIKCGRLEAIELALQEARTAHLPNHHSLCVEAQKQRTRMLAEDSKQLDPPQ